MRRKFAYTFFLMVIISIANAHEFWLQPKQFRLNTGEELKVDFMVGENFTGEFWNLKRHRVEMLKAFTKDGEQNILDLVKSTEGNNLAYKLDKEGTYLIAMESNSAYIEMKADKFNDYLKEDGMDNILADRTKAKTLDKDSKEYYKRFAKLLVQAGNTTDNTFSKKLGFRYEIIPQANPYSLKAGDYLECVVLWEGKPVNKSMIKTWNRVGNKTELKDLYTDDKGSIKFLLKSGSWMVSGVRMINSEKEGADYQSLWTSLVFGIN